MFETMSVPLGSKQLLGFVFDLMLLLFCFEQKLKALKKAYADIILNTAKEAAARIMVSERKAMRFQQELVSTKEESLRMLLRLKHMLDSKVVVVFLKWGCSLFPPFFHPVFVFRDVGFGVCSLLDHRSFSF